MLTEKELAELDLAVARVEFPGSLVTPTVLEHCAYHPTRDGAEVMRLLQKYWLEVDPGGPDDICWTVRRDGRTVGSGVSLEVAICRAVVALKAT